jgi:hypothetical protein
MREDQVSCGFFRETFRRFKPPNDVSLIALACIVERMKVRFSSFAWAALLMVVLPCSAQSFQIPSRTPRASSNACSMPGLAQHPGRELKAEELLNAYNAQAALVHSLQASTMLRTQGGAELTQSLRDSRPFPASLLFKAPAAVHVTGLVPFSSRRSFDMASDGREFRLLVPDKNAMRLIIGPVDAPANSPNPREDIRPNWILEAIFLLPAKLANRAAAFYPKDRRQRSLEVELTTSAGKRQQAHLEFDLQTGDLARMNLEDEKGQTATEIVYSDWQNAPSVGSEPRQVCFPRRMLVTEFKQNRELEIKFLNVELNSRFTPSQFQVNSPPGIRVTRVGGAASGNTDHR